MYKRQIKVKFNLLKIALIWLLIISVFLTFTYFKMQPVILRYTESVAETLMLNTANEAIIEILENENIKYNDIAKITKNGDVVTSLEIDIYYANLLKSKISNKISSIIAKKERYTVAIPVGTFFSNAYTSGLGPDFKFKMQITTTAFVDFENEFKSAGINQVLHIINAKISMRGTIIIAGYRDTIKADTTAIVAQSVIVGTVPDAFTSVIESENDNTGGLINDYGALS